MKMTGGGKRGDGLPCDDVGGDHVGYGRDLTNTGGHLFIKDVRQEIHKSSGRGLERVSSWMEVDTYIPTGRRKRR